MRNRGFILMAVLGCVLIAAPVLAQNPTGTITGRVMQDEGPLPGVTITASSPSMQGQKTAISGAEGEYIFVFLPPGQYTVTYALDGFRTLEMPVVVSTAQTKTVDAKMYIEAIREEITVTGDYETVSVGTQSNVTISADLIDSLPIGRTMNSAVLLTPGTYATGPSGNITISGAASFENLFLVNGVVVNDNVRNTPYTLYIEDAIEETTTTASGVSAAVRSLLRRCGQHDHQVGRQPVLRLSAVEHDQRQLERRDPAHDRTGRQDQPGLGGHLRRLTSSRTTCGSSSPVATRRRIPQDSSSTRPRTPTTTKSSGMRAS